MVRTDLVLRPREAPESDGAEYCWLQSLEAPPLPPVVWLFSRDPGLIENQLPEKPNKIGD
jgi:hypothetical protein